MRDEKGFDFKVLCVALGDAHQQHIERLEQVRPHRLVEIEQFFNTYKQLEKRPTEVSGWLGVDEAWRIIDGAMAAGASGDPARTQPGKVASLITTRTSSGSPSSARLPSMNP